MGTRREIALLPCFASWMECKSKNEYDAGDHELLIGKAKGLYSHYMKVYF